MTRASDEDLQRLVERAKGGDNDAFSQLTARLQGRLWGFAFKLGLNGEDARDVVQEVLLKLYQHLGDYNPARATFTAYALWITRNTAFSLGRKLKITAIRPLPPEGEALLARGLSPEEVLGQREASQLLKSLLGDLPEQERVALTLHYLEGKSHQEAAEELDISVAAFNSRLTRARARLRPLAADKGLAPGSE
jgi:RNA polymerase sigma-70 factor (ECF subfamily)